MITYSLIIIIKVWNLLFPLDKIIYKKDDNLFNKIDEKFKKWLNHQK
jgi:hypothetical protein